MEFLQKIKFVNYIKLFKNKGSDCHNLNVTTMSYQRDDLSKFQFGNVSGFSYTWKEGGEVFGKIPWCFDIILLTRSIL